MWKNTRLIAVAILCAMPLAGHGISANAQNFDGTWTGSTGCPVHGTQTAWTEQATATIVQNQFRLERNNAVLHEITQGTVGPDGFVSAGGQGERRDRPVTWASSFSGKASATTMNLNGTRSQGRPCWIHLTNTRPAPYSLAGQGIARQQQLAADAEAEKRTEAERQAAAARAQREKSAKERAAEAQLQQLRAEAERTKQKAAEFDKKLSTQAQKQASADAQLEKLRAEAEAAKKRADDADKELAALRATQQEGQEQQKKVVDFLNDMMLPDSEKLVDWISRNASIPIQQQQFCLIVQQFYPDLVKIEQIKNDIRRNTLYRDRQKDLETLLPRGRFDNWVLRVKEVKQDEDGNASILLQAPCKVMFGSDSCPKTRSKVRATIQKDTSMFRELAKLGRDDFVVASGAITLLSHEDQKQELPQYAIYRPGEYCAENDSDKRLEVFVAEMNYLVQLR